MRAERDGRVVAVSATAVGFPLSVEAQAACDCCTDRLWRRDWTRHSDNMVVVVAAVVALERRLLLLLVAAAHWHRCVRHHRHWTVVLSNHWRHFPGWWPGRDSPDKIRLAPERLVAVLAEVVVVVVVAAVAADND